MMIPSLQKCLAIYAVRMALFLTAWFLVPLGFVTGMIRKGPRAFGQWSGAQCMSDGTILYNQTIESIECRGPFKVFDVPDEPGIGLYECTVASIYRKFGWYGAVWYQLALRNVGHGWLAMFSTALPYDRPLATLETTTLGIWYGLKRYENWREYSDSIQPIKPSDRKYYGIPSVGFSPEYAVDTDKLTVGCKR